MARAFALVHVQVFTLDEHLSLACMWVGSILWSVWVIDAEGLAHG